MKRIILILIGIGIINDASAQNALDRVGLSSVTPAASAYSLRLLSNAYSGAAIQIRRSSDNALLDIGFTSGGSLDTVSLKTFVSINSGYVSKWYDQSGNGLDAVQASQGSQPLIVNAGIIENNNNRPYLTLSGNQWLSIPMSFNRSIYPSATVNMVYQNTSLTGNQALWGCDDGGWDRFQLLSFSASPSIAYGLSNGGGTAPNATNNSNRNVYTAIMNNTVANGSYVVINGIIGTPFTENGTGSTNNLAIGAMSGSGGYGFIGNTSEFFLFTSSLPGANRQTLELNQASYYSMAAPVIMAQPSNIGQRLCINGTAKDLSVMATGTGTLTYQWYRNTANSNFGGTPISGATNSTYTPSTSITGTLYYYVMVADGGFPVTSNVSAAIEVQGPLSATVNTANPTCLTNGSIVITNPQTPATHLVLTDFSSLPLGATLSGSATISGGECILTPAQSNQSGYIVFPVMPTPPNSFTATFDYRAADGNGADGTSFNYGIITGGGTYENGILNTGLIVRFIEYGSSRVQVVYNGSSVISVPFALINTSYRTFVLSVSPANEISLTIGGIAVFTNVPLPAGFSSANKSSWQFAFASRCGGMNNKHSIKNLDISNESLQYSVDGLTWQTANSFSLPAATYNVQARLGDAVSCPIANIATVTLSAPVIPIITIGGITTALDSVSLTATGALSYVWTGGNSPGNAQNTFTQSGDYAVTGKDASGCSGTANVTIQINILGLNKYGKISTDSAVGLSPNGAVGAPAKVDKNGKIRGSNGYNGLTAGTAAPSAYAIKQMFPSSPDGYYWIKNANINGGAPFQIYADMTTDGGGWTLIMCNTSPNPGWTNAQALLRNQNSPSISSTYSIIGWADNIKKSSSGFQYMLDAQTRRSNGGIWTANSNYSFVSTSNANTNITLNTKFGTWNYSDNDLEPNMPWYSPGSQGIITTSRDANNAWWGTLIASGGWDPAPWMNATMANPGIIWYWVR